MNEQLRAEQLTTTDPTQARAERIRRLVDTFPPLSAEQRDRLAALLGGTRQSARPARPQRLRDVALDPQPHNVVGD